MRNEIQRYYQTHAYNGPVQFVRASAARASLGVFKDNLPGVGVFYALKSFNDSHIIKALDSGLDGYDVASVAECRDLHQAGVSMDRLLFANPVKSVRQIQESYQLGVRRYVIQSVDELKKMIAHAPEAKLLVRLKINDTANTTGQKFSMKFGASTDVVHEIIGFADDAGVKIDGLSFHVGSQCESSIPWIAAITAASEIMNQHGLKLLDIGGGFPVDYEKPEDETFYTISADIRNALKLLSEGVQVIAEPGRFLSARSASMSASVIGRESRDGREWAYTDVGIFQGLYEAVEFHRLLQPISLLIPNGEPKGSFVVAGPTCDGDDIVSLDCPIESTIQDDDILLIEYTGAYIESYQATLNGFDPPVKVFLD